MGSQVGWLLEWDAPLQPSALTDHERVDDHMQHRRARYAENNFGEHTRVRRWWLRGKTMKGLNGLKGLKEVEG